MTRKRDPLGCKMARSENPHHNDSVSVGARAEGGTQKGAEVGDERRDTIKRMDREAGNGTATRKRRLSREWGGGNTWEGSSQSKGLDKKLKFVVHELEKSE